MMRDVGQCPWVLTSAVWLSSCAAPALDGTTFRCESNSECRADEVCGPVEGQLACVLRSSAPLRVGMSGPLQGASRDLGTEMRRGINALFSRVNADYDGVYGRPLELVSMNDSYDPALALEVTRQLLDVRQPMPEQEPDLRGPDSVFALLGSVGTPTMLATAPVATKNRVPFFAPFSGAQTYLRDGVNSPYVYNYRAGYYDEAAAIIDYLATTRLPRVIVNSTEDHDKLIVFAQNDSYGDAGYEGLVEAYNRSVGGLPSRDAIARVGYERDDVDSVQPAVAEVQRLLLDQLVEGAERRSAAVVMIDTYQPGNLLIRSIKDWLGDDAQRAAMLDVLFIHVSFVGSDSLAAALTSAPAQYPNAALNGELSTYAEGVMVTQVVPSYTSEAWGVSEYRRDIDRFDGGPYTFTSLEGYIAARLFASGLELAGPELTTETFLAAMDNEVRDLDIGIGTLMNFSSTDHQASDAVWLSELTAEGDFAVPYVWTPSSGIEPN